MHAHRLSEDILTVNRTSRPDKAAQTLFCYRSLAGLQDPIELYWLQVRRWVAAGPETGCVRNGAAVREHLDAPDAGSGNEAAVSRTKSLWGMEVELACQYACI